MIDFISIRIITADIARRVDFYERATGISADWSTEDFAEISTPTGTVAMGSTRTVPTVRARVRAAGRQSQRHH